MNWFWAIQNLFTCNPPPLRYVFIRKRTMTSYVAHHVPFLVGLESKMAASGVCQVFFALVLACLFDQVSAFDGGDAAALIIGLIFGIMAICACLGAYARRQQGVWRAISNRTHFEQREEVLKRGFWEFTVDIFTSYIWNSIPSAFFIWLNFIFLVDTVARTFCFYSEVGNGVFGRIDPLDK